MPHSEKKTIKAIENASRDDLVLLMKTIVERDEEPTKFIKYALFDITARERAEEIEIRARNDERPAKKRKIVRETAVQRGNKRRKRWFDVCRNCDGNFDPYFNIIDSCCYHSGMIASGLVA